MKKNEYEKLLRDIGTAGQKWSTYDLTLAKENPDAGRSLYTQKSNYGKARDEAGRRAANQAAEEVRQKYGGYRGGADGSGYTLEDKYAPPEQTYRSSYSDQIGAVTDELLNGEKFSYDPKKDPSYASYREQYQRLGNDAREDALGSGAAMTGGQLNSYAVTAGQQAQNRYNGQLSDKIPALEALAYEMYLGEMGEKRENLGALERQEAAEYQKFRDSRGDAVKNYQLNYGVGRDDLEDKRYEEERGYEASRDEVSDRRYEEERAEKAQKAEKAEKAEKSIGSGGAVTAMLAYGNDIAAYEYLVGLGLSQSKTDQLWTFYRQSKK